MNTEKIKRRMFSYSLCGVLIVAGIVNIALGNILGFIPLIGGICCLTFAVLY